MNTLFPIEPIYPQGFSYSTDFITLLEEQELIEIVKKIELHKFTFQGYTANRKVASFGYDYNFENSSLTKGAEIPKDFDWLIQRVSNFTAIPLHEFAELLVIEYPIGSVINWHRDAPPFDIIAGISLGSDCIFKLRPHDKAKQGRGSIISVPVARRSLYLMTGESRTDWQHSIAAVKQARYSITLRSLRGNR